MNSKHKNSVTALDVNDPKWPYFAEDEINAVIKVLKSGKVNYWTGQEIKLFEKEFAAAAGCKYAVALSNGTVALEIALHSLGLGPGDEVIVTPRTFIASASSAVIQGIIPIFADVDIDSGNITADTIKPMISSRTKAIIVVHLAGWPCDMDPILDLARKHNLKVIEDCAQCHGATYKGQPCGSFGDIAAWSFCQDKIMTTGGEGGMLTTNNKAVWDSAWSFRDHGKSYDEVNKENHALGFKWLHNSFGSNCRMTEMQAAIGRIQLNKLDAWILARRRNAAILVNKLSNLPGIRIPIPDSETGHSYYKFYVYMIPDANKPQWSRTQIMEDCHKRNIPCFSGCCGEIYLENAFINLGLQPSERLPAAKELGETSLMFPVHPTLTEDHMYAYAQLLYDVFKENWNRS